MSSVLGISAGAEGEESHARHAASVSSVSIQLCANAQPFHPAQAEGAPPAKAGTGVYRFGKTAGREDEEVRTAGTAGTAATLC